MSDRMRMAGRLLMIVLVAFSFTGCTFILQNGKRSDAEKISRLKSELSELQRAQKELEDRLSKEISDQQVKVEMLEKGLVITFVSEVLFDSGKSVLRAESLSALDKVRSVLDSTVSDLNVGIEGHTDNDPIRVSGWKSNWELSVGRALSVLHYLTEKGIVPTRLSVIGYGEFRPVVSNDTREGRHKNRRVEIVVLPRTDRQRNDPASGRLTE